MRRALLLLVALASTSTAAAAPSGPRPAPPKAAKQTKETKETKETKAAKETKETKAAKAAKETKADTPPPKRAATGECSDCHTQSRWSEVSFEHARTGFPLEGAHAKASCRACHAADFRARVATTCAGCHRDRHAGELGVHCEGCHEQTTWTDTLFGADAHRRTAFPLLGKHAAIPCQECHGELRDRTFSRAPTTCIGCHAADFSRTAARTIDHLAAGFSTDCQSCHTTWSFAPARFAAHDTCFPLGGGAHASLRCQQCHSRVAGLVPTGACRTQSVTCASCHAHQCARSDAQHANVMGYGCVSQKCYECHQRLPGL